MNQDQFAYWLQGFVEMNGGKEPTKEQWKMIKEHLQLCFKKLTPPLMPYAKGVGTGGVGDGVLGAGVLHRTPNGYVHVVGGGGTYASGGAGWPIDKYGRQLTNAEIEQRKTKGGGGGC
jgi:hypothetical protein